MRRISECVFAVIYQYDFDAALASRRLRATFASSLCFELLYVFKRIITNVVILQSRVLFFRSSAFFYLLQRRFLFVRDHLT